MVFQKHMPYRKAFAVLSVGQQHRLEHVVVQKDSFVAFFGEFFRHFRFCLVLCLCFGNRLSLFGQLFRFFHIFHNNRKPVIYAHGIVFLKVIIPVYFQLK